MLTEIHCIMLINVDIRSLGIYELSLKSKLLSCWLGIHCICCCMSTVHDIAMSSNLNVCDSLLEHCRKHKYLDKSGETFVALVVVCWRDFWTTGPSCTTRTRRTAWAAPLTCWWAEHPCSKALSITMHLYSCKCIYFLTESTVTGVWRRPDGVE